MEQTQESRRKTNANPENEAFYPGNDMLPASSNDIVAMQGDIGHKAVRELVTNNTEKKLPAKSARKLPAFIQRKSPAEEIIDEHAELETGDAGDKKEITGETPPEAPPDTPADTPPDAPGDTPPDESDNSVSSPNGATGDADERMAHNEVTEDQLASANEPEFKQAIKPDTQSTPTDEEQKNDTTDEATQPESDLQPDEANAAKQDNPQLVNEVQTETEEVKTTKPEEVGISGDDIQASLKQDKPDAAITADKPEAGDKGKKVDEKGENEEATGESDALQETAEEGSDSGGSPLGSVLNERRQAANKASADADFQTGVIEDAQSQGQTLATSSPQFIPGDTNNAQMQAELSTANSAVAGFMTTASERINNMTQVAQSSSDTVNAAMQQSVEMVMAHVIQEQQALAATIEQVKAQVQASAAAAKAQITSASEATVANIQAASDSTRAEIEAQFLDAQAHLLEQQEAQNQSIEAIYTKADADFRQAGVTVGDEAVTRGEAQASQYLSQKINRKDSFLDGYLTDRRCEARAKAAREVSKQYRQGLIDAAKEQADNALKGKPRDLETVSTVVSDSQTTLDSQYESTLADLDAQTASATEQVQSSTASLLSSVDSALQSSLTALDQQLSTQTQVLSESSETHQQSIVEGAQSTIASINEGTAQAILSLNGALQQMQTQVAESPVPDTILLQEQLGVAMGELDNSVSATVSQYETMAAASASSIAAGASQSLSAISELQVRASSEATNTGAAFDQSMSQMVGNAQNMFSELENSHLKTLEQMTTTAISGIEEVITGIDKTFDTMQQNLEKSFTEAVPKLEEGLRGAFPDMDAKISEEAEKAAAQEQPAWKSVLKVLLVIAVIVVVALVAGPAVIGAVGAMAGALGASAGAASVIGAVVGGAIVGAGAGAVTQMGNNLIDGKDLLEGVGQAMLVGAIGGALGGAGGALGQALGNAGKLGSTALVQNIGKFGIDLGFDISGEILGNLATGQPITFEGVMTGVGTGIAIGGAAGKMSNFKKVQGIQDTSMNFGSKIGDSVGAKIKGVDSVPKPDVDVPASGVTPKPADVDTPTPKAPETDVPSATTPKTDTPTTKAPDNPTPAKTTDVDTPTKPVDTPSAPKSGADTPTKPVDSDAPTKTDTIDGAKKSHTDEPEIEPGIVGKKQVSGDHEVKVRKDGDIESCSSCELVRNKYSEELQNPSLKQELDTICSKGDLSQKLEGAAVFERKVIAARKAKLESEMQPRLDKISSKKAELEKVSDDLKQKQEQAEGKNDTDLDHEISLLEGKAKNLQDTIKQMEDAPSLKDMRQKMSEMDADLARIDSRLDVIKKVKDIPDPEAVIPHPTKADLSSRYKPEMDADPSLKSMIDDIEATIKTETDPKIRAEIEQMKVETEINIAKGRKQDLEQTSSKLEQEAKTIQSKLDTLRADADKIRQIPHDKRTPAENTRFREVQSEIKATEVKLREVNQYKGLVDQRIKEVDAHIQRAENFLDPKAGLKAPCFPGHTLVWTPSGTVPIASLRENDLIYAYDLENSTLIESRVTAIIHSHTDLLYAITTDAGVVEATRLHPFWVESESNWVHAQNLEVGMTLRLLDGSPTTIYDIEQIAIDIPTYNLSVDLVHNYFVGPGLLVHNMTVALDPFETIRQLLGLGDKPVNFGSGPQKVYIGINPNEPGKIYIGITDDIPGRQREHRNKAQDDLAKHQAGQPVLPPRELGQRQFKTGVILVEIANGIDELPDGKIPTKDGSGTVSNKLFIAQVIEEQFCCHIEENFKGQVELMNLPKGRLSADEVKYRVKEITAHPDIKVC